MKVLFLKLVPNIGHIGDIKEVSDSYARNFLIPKGLVKKIDINEEKRLKEQEKKKEENRRNLIDNKHEIALKLNGKQFIFKAKIGNNGKMFGSIKESDIIEKIYSELKIKLEKKHIDLIDGHIKRIGKKDVFVKLSPDNIAKIIIIVE